jgi:UDP:flavonoid glycosyltransferase YjiC (YdhE family)
MRALFCSTDGISHLYTLVPLAWAMRAAGHEVLVAFSDKTADATSTGLQIVDVAPGYDGMAIFDKTLQDNPEFAEIWWHGTDDDGAGLDGDPSAYALMPAELNRPLLEGTLNLVEQWRPDIVVYEQVAAYGLLVASKLGIPAVQRNLGLIRTGGLHEAIAEYLNYVAPAKPALTLEPVPPSMFPFDEAEGPFIRDLPYTGGAVLGPRLPEPGDRPRIAVTFGTDRPGVDALEPLKNMLVAMSDVDAEFVLALGHKDLDPLGDLPANVRSVGWTALEPLFRTCAGVIHHGGGITTMLALEAGIPQLVAVNELYSGQETLAPAVRHGGIGITVDENSVDAATIKRLIADESLRTKTAAVRAEWAGLPSHTDLVPRLVALTG